MLINKTYSLIIIPTYAVNRAIQLAYMQIPSVLMPIDSCIGLLDS